MATSIPPHLANFEGRWQFDRRIRDLAGRQDGVMEGEASFTPDGVGLIYRETGALRLGASGPVRAERTYLWRQGGGGTITVLFADGRPFHEFVLSERPEASHACDPDMYRVAYDFGRWPAWCAVWRVRGPRKDYEMTTDYAPLALGPGMGDTDGRSGVADGRGA